jgi:cytochrome c biogenesis protein
MSDINLLNSTEFARFLWRKLTSMRTAIYLLIFLGIAAIPGSIYPQRTQNPLKVEQYFATHKVLAKWLDKIYFFNVYSSPWFSAIYILLFISLIGCVLPRSWQHLKSILSREAPTKGYLYETGNLTFHLSLIFILIGVALGSLFGMKGQAIINVGGRFVNTATSYDSLGFGKFASEKSLAPFALTVTDFKATYDPKTSTPLDYKLDVDISYPISTKPVHKIIKINSPLTYGSTKIYLQANGYSPMVIVRDRNGQVQFEGAVPFLPQDGNLTSVGAIKLPDANPQIGIIGTFTPTYSMTKSGGAISTFPEALDPRFVFSIWKGNLGLDSGIPQSVYRVDTSKMQRVALKSLRVGESFNYPEGSITFVGWKPWVNIEVGRDSGKSLALLGAVLAIVGLLSSLFIGYRRDVKEEELVS